MIVLKVLFANIVICGILVLVHAASPMFGRVFSMIGAGVIVGADFTFVSWLFLAPEITQFQRRNKLRENILVGVNILFGLALFSLGVAFGEGSFFGLYSYKQLTLNNLILSGGFFGIWMSLLMGFDFMLLIKRRFAQALSLFGMIQWLFWSIVFYGWSDGFLFLICSVITRIMSSWLIHRKYTKQAEDWRSETEIMLFLSSVIVLPVCAYLLS